MNGKIDGELTRLLTGELEPGKAADLRQRLERDAQLARRFQLLEESWRSLELPPPSPIPQGCKTRIMARARAVERARRELEWRRAPLWARASAVAALAAGIALGVGVSSFESTAIAIEQTTSTPSESPRDWSLAEPGLAELYAAAVEQSAWNQEEENGS